MEAASHQYHEILLKFRDYLKRTGRAEKTIYDRLWYMKHFFAFLRDLNVMDPTAINKDHLKEYQRYINAYVNKRGQKDRPRTINTRIQALRLFLVFLYEEDHTARDFSKEVFYIKEPKSLPAVILTNDEVKKIMRQCDTQSIMGYRNRTILEVFYSSGLRRNELIHLKINDIQAVHKRSL